MVLLVLAAGGILAVNLSERHAIWNGGEEVYEFYVEQERMVYGWPSPAAYRLTGKAWYKDGSDYYQSHQFFTWETSYSAIAIDAAVAFGLLSAIALLSEYFIRHRKHIRQSSFL